MSTALTVRKGYTGSVSNVCSAGQPMTTADGTYNVTCGGGFACNFVGTVIMSGGSWTAEGVNNVGNPVSYEGSYTFTPTGTGGTGTMSSPSGLFGSPWSATSSWNSATPGSISWGTGPAPGNPFNSGSATIGIAPYTEFKWSRGGGTSGTLTDFADVWALGFGVAIPTGESGVRTFAVTGSNPYAGTYTLNFFGGGTWDISGPGGSTSGGSGIGYLPGTDADSIPAPDCLGLVSDGSPEWEEQYTFGITKLAGWEEGEQVRGSGTVDFIAVSATGFGSELNFASVLEIAVRGAELPPDTRDYPTSIFNPNDVPIQFCYSVNGQPACVVIPPNSTVPVNIPFEPGDDITWVFTPTDPYVDEPYDFGDIVPNPDDPNDPSNTGIPLIIVSPRPPIPDPDPIPQPDPDEFGDPGITANYQGCIAIPCGKRYIYTHNSSNTSQS